MNSVRKFSVGDTVLTLAVVVTLALVSHFWISDRLGVLRTVYPLESLIYKANLSCSGGAPAWMLDKLAQVSKLGVSPASQIAHVDPAGGLHHCEYGWEGRPFVSPEVSKDTRFRFASVTKAFTAEAVLGLIRERRLDLDSKLVDFLPELPHLQDERIYDISIAHLLQHSAGFDRMSSEDPMFKHHAKPWCPYHLEALATLQLDYSPGEKQSYSNRGYCLLGQVIEQVSGQSYRDYLEARYRLSEYGMQFVDGPYMPDEVRYDFRNSDFYSEDYSKYFDFLALSSVAGLSGNAAGLARFWAGMRNRDELDITSAHLLERCVPSDAKSCYGFSLYRYQPEKQLALHVHEGYFPGAAPMLIFDSEGGITVLLTSGAPLDHGHRAALLHELYAALKHYYTPKWADRRRDS